MSITNENWLHKLFIDEAKAAKDYHNRGGSGGSGGTGGEAGFIDVTEFPTTGIDQDKVYRLSQTVEEDKQRLYFTISPEGMQTLEEVYGPYGISLDKSILTAEEMFHGYTVPFANLLGQQMGHTVSHGVYKELFVDSLPDNPEKSYYDEDNVLHGTVYILTGDPAAEPQVYTPVDGGLQWTSAITLFYFPAIYVGLVDDITKVEPPLIENVYGSYALVNDKLSTTSTSYGIPNEAGTKKAYEHTSTNGWTEFSGDIIDVTELPTDGIDQDKIYRLSESVAEDVFGTRIVVDPDTVNMFGLSSPIMTYEEYANLEASMSPTPITVVCKEYVVDTLPDNPETSGYDQATEVMNYHLYVLKGDNINAYLYVGQWITLQDATGFIYKGVITDESDMEIPESGKGTYYYVLNTPIITTSIHYGIPNEAGTKKAYEHTSTNGWTEFSGDIIDVTELPTNGIDQDKVYRLIGETAGDKPVGLITFTEEQMTAMGASSQVALYEEFLPAKVALEYLYYDGDIADLVNNPSNIVFSTNTHYVFYVVKDPVSGKYAEPTAFMGDSQQGIKNIFRLSVMCFNRDPNTEFYPEVITDISQVTEYGTVYLLANKVSATHYGIPNEDDTKKIYVYTSEAGWREYGPIATTETSEI